MLGALESCLSKDTAICLMCGDPDNLGATLLALFLIKHGNYSASRALDLIKANRIQTSLIRQFEDILTTTNKKPAKKAELQPARKTFRESLAEEFATLYKSQGKKRDRTEKSFELLDRLLKNTIENPEEAKYRQIKKSSKALQENLGKFDSGLHLL